MEKPKRPLCLVFPSALRLINRGFLQGEWLEVGEGSSYLHPAPESYQQEVSWGLVNPGLCGVGS